MFQASPQMITQYGQEAKSNGIASVLNRKKGTKQLNPDTVQMEAHNAHIWSTMK